MGIGGVGVVVGAGVRIGAAGFREGCGTPLVFIFIGALEPPRFARTRSSAMVRIVPSVRLLFGLVAMPFYSPKAKELLYASLLYHSPCRVVIHMVLFFFFNICPQILCRGAYFALIYFYDFHLNFVTNTNDIANVFDIIIIQL